VNDIKSTHKMIYPKLTLNPIREPEWMHLQRI
jgi:hypothetical protein